MKQTHRPFAVMAIAACAMLLSACDYLGIESASKIAEKQDAEGKAMGGACRHSLRNVEDCYRLNPKANKAAIFTGWKDMDVYMRENSIQGVAPSLPLDFVPPDMQPKPPPPKPKPKPEDGEEEADAADAEPSKAAPAGDSHGKAKH
jgi:hypothetical protein